MRIITLAAGLALAAVSTAAFAQDAAAPAAAPAAAAAAPAADHYSSGGTPIGSLLDDPAAKAVLSKYIPDIVNNSQIDMARGMTLKDVQQYSQGALSDDALTKIDADLAKLPVKK
jgi:para-nitrobenzyl esterase